MSVASLLQQTFEQAPSFLAEAPGRIEFIGNHVDYNGGAVLGAAINRHVQVAVAANDTGQIRLASEGAPQTIRVSLETETPLRGRDAWGNYPLGVFLQLKRLGMPVTRGFDLAVTSNLPSGAGLSSSAAFELATSLALTALYGFPLSMRETILLCQRAENEFVGVPCGILDQSVCALGGPRHLVHIDCATTTFSEVPLPAEVAFWIFNTNQKHSLVDSLYATRHRECREVRDVLDPTQHLAHIPLEVLDAHVADLPETLVRRARHVIMEHRRVGACVDALAAGDLATVGRLLRASHESSRHDFENSTPQLDALVDTLVKRDDVYGARLTGGGFGGAVLAFTPLSFDAAAAAEVCAHVQANFPGLEPSSLAVQAGQGAHLLDTAEL